MVQKATFSLYLQQKQQINIAQFARDPDKSASMTGSEIILWEYIVCLVARHF